MGLGGGIADYRATLMLTNSTVSGNIANGIGYDADGGGIFNGHWLTLNSSTVVNNTGSGAGGVYSDSLIPVSFKNTIVACNTTLDGQASDCKGTLTSEGYNLIQTVHAECTITGDTTGNITGQDPILSPLADNGGPTQTHALQATSPAIDQIPDGTNGCAAGTSTDQRGAVRADGAGQGGSACDIGAFESGSNGGGPTAITLQSLTASTGTGTPSGAVSVGLLALGIASLTLFWQVWQKAS